MKVEIHESRSIRHMEKFITHSVSFSEIKETFEYMLNKTFAQWVTDRRCRKHTFDPLF
ncbi:hypothetical protein AMTRI_Chr04g184510 [Amborella trichopoda]